MAGGVTLPGDGTVVATETVGGQEAQIVRLDVGSGATRTPLSSSNPAPVSVQGAVTITPSGTQTVAGTVAVSNLPATQPVSAAALPLPAGASTETTVAVIASSNTTIATNTGAVSTVLGAQADAAAGADTGTFSIMAAIKRLLGKIPALATTIPSNTGAGIPVRPIGQDTTRAGFTRASASTLLSSLMTLSGAIGTGMTVSQSGGNLVIGSGTTASSDTLMRSVKAWQGSWLAALRFTASQRIATSSFMFLLADLIGEALPTTIVSSTSISVTATAHGFTAEQVGQSVFVGAAPLAGCPGQKATIASVPDANTINLTVAGYPASGSTTVTLFGRHHAKVLYNGTVATTAQYATQNAGWGNADAAITTNTSASPGHIIEIHQAGNENYVADTLSASSTTPNVTTRGSSMENVPDDNTDLYLFLWAFNATSAPTATTYTIGFWSVQRFANQPVYIEGVRPQGGQPPLPVAFQSAQAVSQSGTWNVGLNAGTNAVGGVFMRGTTTGGLSTAKVLAAAGTNATVVKAAAGQIYGAQFGNTSAAWRFVKFYNKATAPTVGTDPVVYILAIPPGGARELPRDIGLPLSAGISYAITGAYADSDTTAVTAGDVVGSIDYA